MSCAGQARRVAATMRVVGLAALSGKRSYYLGLAAGTLLATLFRRRRQNGPGTPTTSPILPAPDRVRPLPPQERGGQGCVQCGANRGGLFYRLNGRVYCQTCARATAERTGGALLVPAAATVFSPDELNWLAPPETSLTRARVKAGPEIEVEGYRVSVHGRETGLSLTPEYTSTKDGAVTTNKSRWYVTWERVGQPVGGPFGSVAAAQGLAALLASLDWQRDVGDFETGEIQAAVRLANRYRRQVGMRRAQVRIEENKEADI